MPDPMFARLLGELHQLEWASTEAIRRRARQRSRRQAVIVGVATLATAAALTGAIAVATPRATPPAPIAPNPTNSQPSISPTATPTSSPSPEVALTAIPAAAMLQLADVPPGFVAAGDDIDGDWIFQFLASRCDHQVDGPSRLLVRGQRFAMGEGPDQVSILERVEYRTAAAASLYLANVREQVRLCDTGTNVDMAIVADGFAGDESMVIRTVIEGYENLTIFVRVGGLVAEIWQKELVDLEEARRLAIRAAQRLAEANLAG